CTATLVLSGVVSPALADDVVGLLATMLTPSAFASAVEFAVSAKLLVTLSLPAPVKMPVVVAFAFAPASEDADPAEFSVAPKLPAPAFAVDVTDMTPSFVTVSLPAAPVSLSPQFTEMPSSASAACRWLELLVAEPSASMPTASALASTTVELLDATLGEDVSAGGVGPDDAAGLPTATPTVRPVASLVASTVSAPVLVT